MPNIDTLAQVLSVAAFAVTLIVALLVRPRALTPRRVAALGLAWVLIVTLQYWLLGPYSYIFAGDEAMQPVANFLHWHKHFDGGQFIHGPVGGLDARAMIVGTASLVSLDRLVLALLPLWLAVFLQKTVVAAVAMSGAYVLARRAGAGLSMALVLGAFYSVAHHYLALATFHNGLAYPLIPWFIYAAVMRVDDRAKLYFGRLAVLAAVHAVSSQPTHTLMATFPAIVFSALIVGTWRPRRLALALGLILAPIVVNWGEGLYALTKVAPTTGRVHYEPFSTQLGTLIDQGIPSTGYGLSAFLALAVALAALVVTRQVNRWRIVVACAVLVVMGPLLMLVPWRSLGLGPLAAIHYTYTKFAVHAVVVLVIAVAAVHWRTRFAGRALQALPLAATMGLAMGMMSWQKVEDFSYWVGNGGQSTFNAIPNLVDRPWAPAEDFRVVTVPFRLRHNYMLTYGLDTFDGQMNAIPNAYYEFWQNGLVRNGRFTRAGGGVVAPPDFDPMCCESHDFDAMANVALLRQGNVGFVISAVPLRGRTLRQVSGPADGRNPFLRSQPTSDKLKAYGRRIVDPGEVFVYAIGTPTPRVFAATGLELADDALPGPDYLARVASHVDDRIVMVRRSDLPAGVAAATAAGAMTVVDYTLSGQGFDVAVSAPQGGVLVINTAYLPFWTATAGDVRLPVFPVNGIHAAMIVPPGAERIAIRYDRGSLRDAMGAWIGGLRPAQP